MSRKFHLLIIILFVVSITAITSHGLTAWLKIQTKPVKHWVIAPMAVKPSVFVAGSSLASDGLSFGRISDSFGIGIETWGVAGSAPTEWEHFQHLARDVKHTVLVVSVYDLNEYFLCNYRAEIVPLKQTIHDLKESNSEWVFSKKVLNLYPTSYLRKLFPTISRSQGVIAGLRDKLRNILRGTITIERATTPTLSFEQGNSTEELKTEKISSWNEGRMLRRLTAMRSACKGRHQFNGPKKQAFHRMLRQAQGENLVVVVLPVSPKYKQELLTPQDNKHFEEAITEAKNINQQAQWIRLDQMDELYSDDFFWDLVHMNYYGQQIATEAFMRRLKKIIGLL